MVGSSASNLELRDSKHQFQNTNYEGLNNKTVLQKIKIKLKKFKKENKKNKYVQSQIASLMKLVNEQLKYSRSISLSKVKRTGDLISSNILYSKNSDKDIDTYVPNPDTFRKLDTDRGYESQGVNNFMIPGIACQEQKYSTKTKKMSNVDESKFKLPLHLVNKNHQLSLVQNSSRGTERNEHKSKMIF